MEQDTTQVHAHTPEGETIGFRSSAETDKLYAALVKAQAKFRPVQKSNKNTEQNFRFANLNDYTEASKEGLNENGLAIISHCIGIEPLPDHKFKSGSVWYRYRVTVGMRLVHKSGQWLEVMCFGEGLDGGDKGFYKAFTGARKYGYAALLGLATTDDLDGDNPPERGGEQGGQRPQPGRGQQYQRQGNGQSNGQRGQYQQRPSNSQPVKKQAPQQVAEYEAPPPPDDSYAPADAPQLQPSSKVDRQDPPAPASAKPTSAGSATQTPGQDPQTKDISPGGLSREELVSRIIKGEKACRDQKVIGHGSDEETKKTRKAAIGTMMLNVADLGKLEHYLENLREMHRKTLEAREANAQMTMEGAHA